MEYKFRAIERWPRKLCASRRSSQFASTYEATLDLLDKELNNLRAKNIVIQLALRPEDIRLDGLPRANARPAAHPGVILSFDSKNGPLSFACDAFLKWKCNLRGIAMTIERLRLVDLYGVTSSGEQYQGWAALPAPTGEISTIADAVEFLVRHAGIVIDPVRPNADAVKLAYKKCCRTMHPDAGGEHEQFTKLQAANALLSRQDRGQ